LKAVVVRRRPKRPLLANSGRQQQLGESSASWRNAARERKPSEDPGRTLDSPFLIGRSMEKKSASRGEVAPAHRDHCRCLPDKSRSKSRGRQEGRWHSLFSVTSNGRYLADGWPKTEFGKYMMACPQEKKVIHKLNTLFSTGKFQVRHFLIVIGLNKPQHSLVR